jgi:hypothetical protein
MRFLIMIILSCSFMPVAQAVDNTYRQACIDELQTEVNNVCNPRIQQSTSTIVGLFKNASYIYETNDRVRKICSYHCPQDIAEACNAMLDKGPALIKAYLAGGPNAPSYSGSCKIVQGKIDDAKKAIADSESNSSGSDTATAAAEGNSNVKGSFRKVSSEAPAKSTACDPYNESGAFVMGKCPN